uniref:Uncharacterized protein n=1 Tax=Anguilla anguilla TaxID=7936 RepID=A0A0E9WG15_ANGAN
MEKLGCQVRQNLAMLTPLRVASSLLHMYTIVL